MTELYKELAINTERMTELYKESVTSTRENDQILVKEIS